MPKQPTKGKTMLAAEVRTEVVEAFRAYVSGRGEKMSAALERAIRREMAFPPPPESPLPPPPLPPIAPLPDVPPPTPEGKKPGPKKRRT